MKIHAVNDENYEFSGNPNRLEYCDSCALPMFSIYYQPDPDKKVRHRCDECGGSANPRYDAREMLIERIRGRRSYYFQKTG